MLKYKQILDYNVGFYCRTWNLDPVSKSRFLDMLHKSVIKSDVAIEIMSNLKIDGDNTFSCAHIQNEALHFCSLSIQWIVSQ